MMTKRSHCYLLAVILSLVLGTNGFGIFSRKDSGAQVRDDKLQCSNDPVDIMLVLDSSSSIWPPDFKTLLQFVKDLIDQFDVGIGPTQVRLGVMSFSNWAQMEVYLDESIDTEEMKRKIDNMRQLMGNTNTGDAMRLLRNEAFVFHQGSRYWARKVAILITDGKSQNKITTQFEAQACKDSGIELFAIGIGYYTSERELRGIASQPKGKHYMHKTGYNALDRLRHDLVKKTCKKVTPKPTTVQTTLSTAPTTTTTAPPTTPTPANPIADKACRNKVADVFFLLDSSASIRIIEFKKQLNVIEDIVRKFDVGPSRTRIGVSIFSNEYYSKLKFRDTSDKEEIIKIIADIDYLGGGTTTGKALREMRLNEFNRESVRLGADKIAIIFTDGQTSDPELTSNEAKLLKESGVKIFVVGIGPFVDRIELEDLASRPSRVFVHTFESFDELVTKSELISRKTCTVDKQIFVKEEDVCNSTRMTDLQFMVSNNHFGKWKTSQILKASAEVVRRVGSRGAFNFGTLFDECLPKQGIRMGSIKKERQLVYEIVDFRYGTLSSLIRQLRIEDFSPEATTRKIGLLFLDNTIELDDPQIIIEIKHAMSKGIRFYAVVIGEGVDVAEVEKSIVPKKRILFIKSYDSIVSSLPFSFTEKLCSTSPNTDVYKPELS